MESNDGLGLCKPSCGRQERQGESLFVEIWNFFTQKQFELCQETMVEFERRCVLRVGAGSGASTFTGGHGGEGAQVHLERWVRALNGRI